MHLFLRWIITIYNYNIELQLFPLIQPLINKTVIVESSYSKFKFIK